MPLNAGQQSALDAILAQWDDPDHMNGLLKVRTDISSVRQGIHEHMDNASLLAFFTAAKAEANSTIANLSNLIASISL